MAMTIDAILGMNTAAKFAEAKKEILETEKRKAQGNAAIAEFLEPFSWKCERWNHERRQSRHHVTNEELNEMYWHEYMATRESGGSIYDAAENGAYVQAYS